MDIAPKKQLGEWSIEITPSAMGFAPAYFDDSYPFFGGKSQLSAMVNLDLTDPNVMMQGPAPETLASGDQTGAVTTLIKSIMRNAVSSNISFAIGGAKLYQITSTAVSNAGIWPHTITISTDTIVGEDIISYKSAVYYLYNDTTANAGDIGYYDLSTTFNDDWGSTVPTGKGLLMNAPHQVINGGDDVMYFANGKYVGTFDGTTLDPTGLDFQTDAQVSSIAWNLDKIWIAVNRPNISGTNSNQSAVYNWNGVDPSWNSDPVTINGLIGALYVKNGIVYMWWQENGTSNRYNFGYHAGTRIVPLAAFSGTCPTYNQVGESRGFITWISSGLIYMWGATDPKVFIRAFQYCSASYTTAGGLASPFGSMMFASTDGATPTTHYKLEIPSLTVKTTTSSGKSIAFNLSSAGVKSTIDSIHVSTDPLETGAKCDFTLTYDKAKSSITSGTGLNQIAYDATKNTTMHKVLNKGVLVEDFRLDWSFANGSTSKPVKIRAISIHGHYSPNL